MNNEYVQWHENFLNYYKIRVSKEKLLDKVSEHHPNLDSTQSIQNRIKNYSRKNNNKYQRTIYLDDLFAICKATQANPNDILLSEIANNSAESPTLSKISIYDLAQIIKSYSKDRKSEKLFWQCFPITKKFKCDIYLPNDLIFVSSLINIALDNFWEVYDIDSSSEPKTITYSPLIDFYTPFITDLVRKITIADIDIFINGFIYDLSEWKIENDAYIEANGVDDKSDDIKLYNHFSNHQRFELSFSLFLFAMSILTIQKFKTKNDTETLATYLNEHVEIKEFIIKLLNNSIKRLNSVSFVNCHGIIVTYEQLKPKTRSKPKEIKREEGSFLDTMMKQAKNKVSDFSR